MRNVSAAWPVRGRRALFIPRFLKKSRVHLGTVSITCQIYRLRNCHGLRYFLVFHPLPDALLASSCYRQIGFNGLTESNFCIQAPLLVFRGIPRANFINQPLTCFFQSFTVRPRFAICHEICYFCFSDDDYTRYVTFYAYYFCENIIRK